MRLPRYPLAALLALACSSPSGPSDPAALLAQNQALWNRRGPANYQYTITRQCECLPEMTGPATVVVRNGQVDARRYTASGASVDPQFEDLFTAVPGLFDLIAQAVNLPAAAIAARYDPSYGYPTSIQIDWFAGSVDDEVSYRITNFTPLAAR
jgi:hypothetical protein